MRLSQSWRSLRHTARATGALSNNSDAQQKVRRGLPAARFTRLAQETRPGAIREFQFPQSTDLHGRVKRSFAPAKHASATRLRHAVQLSSKLRTWLRRRRGESGHLQRRKLFQGTKHQGHEFIAAAVSGVIENVKSVGRPSSRQLPSGYQWATDIIASVDQDAWDAVEFGSVTDQLVLFQKCRVPPVMRNQPGETQAEFGVLKARVWHMERPGSAFQCNERSRPSIQVGSGRQ